MRNAFRTLQVVIIILILFQPTFFLNPSADVFAAPPSFGIEMTAHSIGNGLVKWAPAGDRLVTVHWWAGYNGFIWNSSNLSLEATLHAPGGVGFASWSPDGMWLLYESMFGDVVVCPRSIAINVTILANANDSYPADYPSTAWSEDGARLAIADGNGTLGIWQTGNWIQPVLRCSLSAGWQALCWSPDGKTIATGDETGAITLRDSMTLATLHSFTGHAGGIDRLAWCPEGSALASKSDDDTVRIWNASRWDCVLDLDDGSSFTVKSFSWSPTGDAFAYSGDHSLNIWRYPSLTVLVNDSHAYSQHNERLEWSPDGTILLYYYDDAGLDGWLNVWDMRSFSRTQKTRMAIAPIVAFAWSPDSEKFVSAGIDRMLLWSLDSDVDGTIDPRDSFPFDSSAIMDTDSDGAPDAFLKDLGEANSTTGLHLDHFPLDPSASIDWDRDGWPDSWNPGRGQADSTEHLRLDAFPTDPSAHADANGDGRPDNRPLTGPKTGDRRMGMVATIPLWPPWRDATPSNYNHCVKLEWSPSGNWLAVSSPARAVTGTKEESVILANRTWQTVQRFFGESQLAWNLDDAIVTWADERQLNISIRHYDGTNWALSGAGGVYFGPYSIGWSRSGRELFLAATDEIVMYDTLGWNLSCTVQSRSSDGENAWIYPEAWSPSMNQFAARIPAQTFGIYDSSNGSCLAQFPGAAVRWEGKQSAFVKAWSSDGARIAIGFPKGKIEIWDAFNWTLIKRIRSNNDEFAVLAWSADGANLAAGTSDTDVRVWNARTWQLIQTLSGHSEGIHSLDWSPDSNMLAVGAGNGTVTIWSVEAYRPPLTVPGPGSITYIYISTIILGCVIITVLFLRIRKKRARRSIEPAVISDKGSDLLDDVH